jgi:diguanylate cyclase (GGDEF)-like protein
MGVSMWSDKRKFIWILSGLLLAAFLATSGISYKVAHESLSRQIEETSLPLTSDNIYSEIQQDLLRPIFISSLMAQDTFVRDWVLGGEQEPGKIIRYLKEIQDRYGTVTSFLVSDRSLNYYHATGLLKKISDDAPEDAWFYRVKSLPDKTAYEVNIDKDSADGSKTTVFVNYRLLDYEGKFMGVIGVGLALEKVRQMIALYQIRYNRRVYFTDREGKITLQGDEFTEAGSLQTLPGLNKLATRILTSPSGTFQYQRDNTSIYLNSRLVPEFNWYLIVEQQESVEERQLLATFWGNATLSLVVTLTLLTIANFTLGRYQRKLELMATTDKLTGVANRQMFETYFAELVKQAEPGQLKMSVILLDIDYFKTVNDDYGHQVGDLVLQTVARSLQQQLGELGMVCRWGGEEFLLLLPDIALADCNTLAESIRCQIAERNVLVNGQGIRVTISGGVAEYQSGESSDHLLRRADVALYQAKEQGRNRMVLNV